MAATSERAPGRPAARTRMSALPRIPQLTVEQIKLRADLPALLAHFGAEKGSNGQYLCPFHDEKTASMTAYPASSGKATRYQCFGCGAGGDAIDLAQKLGGLSFPDAARLVAERSGIYGLDGLEEPREILEAQAETERPPLGDDVHAILAAAQGFFTDALGSDGDGAAEARDYLQDRGIGPEVANHYGVGFAPPAWSVLLDELVGLGASDAAVVEAGLARNRRTGAGPKQKAEAGRPARRAEPGTTPRQAYDLFRGRLTFPLLASVVEEQGGRPSLVSFEPAGFGGRIVPGLEGSRATADVPKYINSPDSQHFSKGEILFGLPQAAAVLEREEQVVALVEGYLDVMALAEAGIPAAAPCGTAFSAEQAARLRAAGARRVLVLFDGDDAGRAATKPAVLKLLAAGLLPLVGRLGAGDEARGSATDPASLLVEAGAETLRERVSTSAISAVDYLLDASLQQGKLPFEAAQGSAVQGAAFEPLQLTAGGDDVFVQATRLAEAVALSPEPLVRGALVRQAGLALGMPFDPIMAQVYRIRAERAGVDA